MGSDNGGGATWSQCGSSFCKKCFIAIAALIFVIYAVHSPGNDTAYNLREGQKHQHLAGPKYDNYSWKELPSEARVAAMRLGYNGKTWDHSITPDIANKPWGTMMAEEKEAAKVLGYSQRTWDTANGSASSEETQPPTSSGTASETTSGSAEDSTESSEEGSEEGSEESSEKGSEESSTATSEEETNESEAE